SNGEGTAPTTFWWKRSVDARSSSSSITAPPTTSLCPPRYFVELCTTMSAPSDSGFCRHGVAKVLSTTVIAPRAWAMSVTALMSTSRSSGFVGDSSQTILVRSVIASWTAPVASSGPWPTWRARVANPQSRLVASWSATRMRDELEEVGTGHQPDRRCAVDDDDRRVASEQRLERLLDGRRRSHDAEGRVHGHGDRLIDNSRIAVDPVEQGAFLQAADDAASSRQRPLPDGQLRDPVSLHQLDGVAH